MNNIIHFDEKIPIDSSTYIVRCGYLWGLTSNESFIMKPIYDYIWIDSNDKIWAIFNGKTFLVDLNNFPNEYDYIEPSEDGNLLVYKNDLVGVCNNNMNVILPNKYYNIIESNNIYWCCVDKDLQHYLLYRKSGELIINRRVVFNKHTFPVIHFDDGDYNILNDNLKTILPISVDDIELVDKYSCLPEIKPVGILRVGCYSLLYLRSINNYIDIVYSKIEHKLTLYFCYRRAHKSTMTDLDNWSEDAYIEDSVYEIVDIYNEDGHLITELDLSKYTIDRIYHYKSQLTLKCNNKWGVIDETGIVIPFRYDAISRREEYLIGEIHHRHNEYISKEYDVYNSIGKCITHSLCEGSDHIIISPEFPNNIIIKHANSFESYSIDGKRIITTDEIATLGTFIKSGLAVAQSKSGRLGIINTLLEIQIPFEYEKFFKTDISDFIICGLKDNKRCYIFMNNGHARVIQYKYIANGEYDFMLVTNDNINWGIINADGSLITECVYHKNNIKFINKETIILTSNNNDKTVIDKYGHYLELSFEDIEKIYPSFNAYNSHGEDIREKYTQINSDNFGYRAVRNTNNKWGLLNSDNDEVTPFIYDYIWDMSKDGLAAVKTALGCGIIDNTGKYILSPGYRCADPNHSFITPDDIDHHILVIKDGKYGLISPGFIETIPPIYDKLIYSANDHYKNVHYNFETGYIHACKDGKYGILKINGNQVITIIECIYDELEYFFNPTPLCAYDKRYKIDCKSFFVGRRRNDGICIGEVLDMNGKIIDEFSAELFLIFAHERTFIYSTSKYKYGSDYHVIIKHFNNYKQYNSIGEYRGRYIDIIQNGKYGVYDTATGNEVISCKYNSPLQFATSKDIVPANINGKFGFIDISDQIIIEPKYENANVFTEGLAAVSLNGKWGYIDITGTHIIPFNYDSAYEFSAGLALVKNNDLYGYIDTHNNVIIPFKYTEAGNFSNGTASVSTKYYRSKITPKGLEIEYDPISQQRSFDEEDYSKESWYAMTDGMYGDYDGYDGDYDFMGY